MASFLNSSYTNAVTQLMSDANDRMVINPHYMFNQMSPVQCTFYNLNKDGSVYDPATWSEFSLLGPNSPFLYDKIKNATLYGSDLRVLLAFDYGDDGLATAGPIEFELTVLPNTFEPRPNSFISFDMLRERERTKGYLYIVDEVMPDTFDNGANAYRIRCHLYTTGGASIFNGREEIPGYGATSDSTFLEDQVVNTFVMDVTNAGTDIKAVMLEDDYNLASNLSSVIEGMKDFYDALFWNKSVNAYTYSTDHGFYYDPYMIEFIIRNRLFDTSNSGYRWVHHEVPVDQTFSIDYLESVFRAIETRDLKEFTDRNAYGELIDNINTLFVTVPERYFKIVYDKPAMFGLFQPLPSEMIASAQENIEWISTEPAAKWNIITRWFNEGTIPEDTVQILQSIKWKPTKDFFYYIPICIYIINQYLLDKLAA